MNDSISSDFHVNSNAKMAMAIKQHTNNNKCTFIQENCEGSTHSTGSILETTTTTRKCTACDKSDQRQRKFLIVGIWWQFSNTSIFANKGKTNPGISLYQEKNS